MGVETLERRAMLAITTTNTANADQAGAVLSFAVDATVEQNTLTIVLDDTSHAGTVTATVTTDSPSTGSTTATYWNFGSITFMGSADADGLTTNVVNLTTPYQADVSGFGAGAPLSVTNWQLDASFNPSLGTVVLLDLFNADELNVAAATFSADDVSSIAGEFQSPTDLALFPDQPGAVITFSDGTRGIQDNTNIPIRTYQLTLSATNGGLAIDANVSTIQNLSISTNAGSLSLGDPTLPSPVTPRSVSSDTGDIKVASKAGPITLSGVAVTTLFGGISVVTPSTLTVTTGTAVASFTAPALYDPSDTATPVPNGLVRLEGMLGLTLPGALQVTAGRLDLFTKAAAPISLSSLSVGSLTAKTGGSLTIVNAVPLLISDYNATNPSIEIVATDLTIQSPAGIRVVDGITVTGKLVLSTYATGTTTTPTVPVDFVVTGTGDNPLASAAFAGTLRDMIEYVNANAIYTISPPLPNFTLTKQPMQILFDESGSPVATGGTVTLQGTLPAILKPITVDGSLPPSPDPMPPPPTPYDLGGIVGLNGNGVADTGFVLGAGSSGSTIRDVAIYGFTGAGLRVETADNLVSGLTVGADRTGATGAGTGNAIGIEVVGATALRNVIGIRTPGVDTGNTIVGNTQAGVLIHGGANANALYGNTIGTTAGGAANLDGIHVVSSTGTLIGATRTGLGNTIAGNSGNGIRLTTVNAVSPSYGARIVNNSIADNEAAGVLVEGGSRNVIGGASFREGNVIARNSVGVQLQSNGAARTQGNQVVNNTISDSGLGGVLIDQGFGNLVQGNTITDDFDAGTAEWGVRIFRGPQGQGFSANLVYQNTISGAGTSGIDGGSGLDGGIVVENSSGQVIGGPGTMANTLVDNRGSGIVVVGGTGVNIAKSNLIEGNLVGTDKGGTARGNGFDGIRVQGSLGNVVRGNTVRFQDSRANSAAGIGVYDAVGLTAAAGNQVVLNSVGDNYVGVRVSGGSNTAIGGRVAGLGNWVFRSVSDGILVDRSAATGDATATVIKSNRVGLATGPQPAGNGGYGINLVSTVGTTIDQGNLVAYNASGGIRMEGGRNAVIGSVMAGLGNVIRDNGNLATRGDGISLVQPASPGRTEAVLVAGNTIRGNAGNGITVADTVAASAATARVSGITIGRAVATNRPDASTNTIVANAGSGVQVNRAQAVAIIGNAITGNLGAKQIELKNGANTVSGASLGAPILTAASPRVVGQSSPQYDVRGTVSRTGTGTAAQTVFVDIYGTKTATNEQYFLGRVAVTIRAGANAASFRVIVGRPGVQFDQIVATSSLGAGTSEFSNANPV